MKNFGILAAITVAAALASRAVAQQSDDARAVLAESAKAVQSASSLTFHGKKYATGILKEIVDCEGDVKVWREKPDSAPMILVISKVKQPGGPDKHVHYVRDGSDAKWLDERANDIYERPITDSLALQEFSVARQIMPDELTSGRMYDQLLSAAKLVKLADADVNGERCSVIQGEQGNRVMTWSISSADKLPRRVELTTAQGQVQMSMILDLTKVDAAAKLGPDDFRLSQPPGVTPSFTGGRAIPPQVVEMGLKPGVAAPAFSFKTADGKDCSLAGMKGDVVVLEFFGSMFKASAVGSASLQAMTDEFKGKNVKFVGLACREANEATAKDYFKTNGLTYTLVPKADAAVADYKVVGFPSYYVIDAKGNVAAFYQNFPSKDVMTSTINQAMQAK